MSLPMVCLTLMISAQLIIKEAIFDVGVICEADSYISVMTSRDGCQFILASIINHFQIQD